MANTTSYQPTVIAPGIYIFYVESFDAQNPNCKSITRTPISLTIIEPPLSADIELSVCRDINNGTATFYLQNTNDLISANPAHQFTYHVTYNQALDNTLALVDPYMIPGNFDQTIYVRVWDVNGCFSIAELLLHAIPEPTASITTFDLSCPGAMDGAVDITSIIAEGNITSSLNSGSYTTNLVYNNLDTGSYTLSIQDSLFCTNEYTFNILSANEIYIDDYTIACDNNGTINDPADDFYTLSFNLSSAGAGSLYELIVDMINIGQFNYGVTNVINLPADGTTHTLRFFDPATGCDEIMITLALSPCSDPCVVFPSSTILVDPSNVLDCSVTAINLSSLEETNVSYQWSLDNNPLSNLTILQEGQIVLLAIDTITGCQSIDTLDIINLEAYPLIDLGLTDSLSCTNQTVVIDASLSQIGNQFSYNWYFDGMLIDNFNNLNIIDANVTGWYILEIQDVLLGCVNSDSVFVEEISSSWDITLATELTFNDGGNSLNLTTLLPSNEINSILWSPDLNLSCNDCLNPTILESGIDQYSVIITDIYGCVDSATINIRYLEKEIYNPNSFSPNGDGINDYFELGLPSDLELSQLEMWIFNRWGELVYYQDELHTKPSTAFWDGRFKNQPVNPGVFVYYYKATTKQSKKLISAHGDLTLIH